jgi:Protein of unknown function (DUF2631)
MNPARNSQTSPTGNPCRSTITIASGGPVAGTSLERRSGAGDSEPARHGGEVARVVPGQMVPYNRDAPSEEWGWHGTWREFAPRGSRFLLWLGVVGLVLLALFGNHESRVEDYWVLSIAALMAIWLVAGEIQLRKERARRP